MFQRNSSTKQMLYVGWVPPTSTSIPSKASLLSRIVALMHLFTGATSNERSCASTTLTPEGGLWTEAPLPPVSCHCKWWGHICSYWPPSQICAGSLWHNVGQDILPLHILHWLRHPTGPASAFLRESIREALSIRQWMTWMTDVYIIYMKN